MPLSSDPEADWLTMMPSAGPFTTTLKPSDSSCGLAWEAESFTKLGALTLATGSGPWDSTILMVVPGLTLPPGS